MMKPVVWVVLVVRIRDPARPSGRFFAAIQIVSENAKSLTLKGAKELQYDNGRDQVQPKPWAIIKIYTYWCCLVLG
jgi:hypothetical protein